MAAIVETWLDCELTAPVQVKYLKGVVFTMDSYGNRIGVHVYKDGAPVTLTGSVTGYCVLANGDTVPVAGTRSGSDAYIDLIQACYTIPGPISIVLKITESSSIVTLCCVVATVYSSQTSNIITPSQAVIDDWAQQIAATLQQCIDATAGTVKYSVVQSLTDAQKAQARANIGATGGSEIADVVRYGTVQSLSDAQKTLARANIEANVDVGLFVGNDGYIYQEYTT